MEFLNFIALPHSEQVSKLLEIFFFAGLSLFFLYFAFLVGSLFYSIVYFFKAKKFISDYFLNVAKNFIYFASKGYISILGLGLVPFLSVYFSLLQFMQKPPYEFSLVFFSSFVLFVIGIIFLKISNFILLKEQNPSNISNSKIIFLTLSLITIFIVVLLTIGIYSFAINNKFSFNEFSLLNIFNIHFLIRILIFVIVSFLVSSLAYIFKLYTLDKISAIGNHFPENGIIHRILSNVLIFANILPIFSLVYFVALPKELVVLENYIFIVISLLILLLAVVLSYFSLKDNKVTFARTSFYLIILSSLLLFASETSLLSISNKVQEFKISKSYLAYHDQILISAGRNIAKEVNGEEIYKAKCIACHQFETKLVGPPHKEVLKKYENRKEDMVKYILNPVKVDPNYPPMPNQGLKPNEAEAVVKYMFEHYGPMIK
ncbi:MAG: c-type cytochrome [Ignavibacteria bacterium]|nr:c-type cytochrome [Ignavibacteria bacterium]